MFVIAMVPGSAIINANKQASGWEGRLARNLDARAVRIKTYVAELLEELPQPVDSTGFASAACIRRKKLSSLAVGCGSRIVYAELLRELDRELEVAGIYTQRPLSSPALGCDDWVQLSRQRFSPDELFA